MYKTAYRNILPLFLGILICSFLLCGCGKTAVGDPNTAEAKDSQDTEIVNSEDMPDTEITNPEASVGQEAADRPENAAAVDYSLYDTIIDHAQEAWGTMMPEEDDETISIIFYDAYHVKSLLGYTTCDIDGNGVEELIFAEEYSGGEDYPGGMVIYNMYTIVGDEVKKLFDGWDRNRYYLCEDGTIAREGSNGAANSAFDYYCLRDDELILKEAVIYDAERDPEEPWFRSETSEFDASDAKPVSEDEAMAVINGYVYRQLELSLFLMPETE